MFLSSMRLQAALPVRFPNASGIENRQFGEAVAGGGDYRWVWMEELLGADELVLYGGQQLARLSAGLCGVLLRPIACTPHKSVFLRGLGR